MARVTPGEYRLLQALAAREGCDTTLADVANELGEDYQRLRYRLTAMGLKYSPLFTIRASLGGRALSDLLASGEIVADDPAGVTA